MATLLGLNGKHIRTRGDQRRMQRARRIYNGNQNFLDKWHTTPDKAWLAMILVGVLFVGTGIGYAVRLVGESIL